MKVKYSNLSDFNELIALSREVESLFGPMADEVTFQEALRNAILEKNVYCIRPSSNNEDHNLIGAIIISREQNEIAWFAVSDKYKKQGYGKQLLKFAIDQLNIDKNIFVQTFDESIPEGKAARKLYSAFGFIDYKDGGLNPAGIPTVIMRLGSSHNQLEI